MNFVISKKWAHGRERMKIVDIWGHPRPCHLCNLILLSYILILYFLSTTTAVRIIDVFYNTLVSPNRVRHRGLGRVVVLAIC